MTTLSTLSRPVLTTVPFSALAIRETFQWPGLTGPEKNTYRKLSARRAMFVHSGTSQLEGVPFSMKPTQDVAYFVRCDTCHEKLSDNGRGWIGCVHCHPVGSTQIELRVQLHNFLRSIVTQAVDAQLLSGDMLDELFNDIEEDLKHARATATALRTR